MDYKIIYKETDVWLILFKATINSFDVNDVFIGQDFQQGKYLNIGTSGSLQEKGNICMEYNMPVRWIQETYGSIIELFQYYLYISWHG